MDTDKNGVVYKECAGAGRFDYVKYDDQANETQSLFKEAVTQIAADIEVNIKSPRAKALALTNLEQVYMWIGKGIRDDQVARNGGADLEEGRCNS